MSRTMFVTYTHPAQLRDPEKQRTVRLYAAEPKTRRPCSNQKNQVHHQVRTANVGRKRRTIKQPPSDDEDIELAVARRVFAEELLPSPEPMLKGSKIDPFSSFPIRLADVAAKAMDYYCHVYAPNLAVQYQLGRQRNIVLAALMPKSMEYQSVIEAVIGFVLSGVADCSDPTSPEGHELLRRRGSALIGLQKRLSCPDLCAGDGTLHTILPFLSIDTMISEPHDVAAHLQGLRRHVELRGGLASSSFTPYQRRLITTVEVSCRVHIESTMIRTGRPPAPIVLEYPEPPLSIQLGQLLTPLPVGFVRLAHQSHFSVQMIEMLAATQAFSLPTPRTTPPPSPSPHLDTRMIRLDILPHLTPLESCIWLALGLNPRGFPGEGFPRSLPILRQKFRTVVADHPAIVHAAARFHLNFKWCLQEFYDNEAVMNVLAWVAINVCSAQEEGEGQDGAPLLCTRAGPKAFVIPWADLGVVWARFGKDWEGLRAVLGQFLWDDGLMVRWEGAWRRVVKLGDFI